VSFLSNASDQIAHTGFDRMQIKSRGEPLHIEVTTHTVEDRLAITLGMAFAQGLGDKKGIRRYVTCRTFRCDEAPVSR